MAVPGASKWSVGIALLAVATLAPLAMRAVDAARMGEPSRADVSASALPRQAPLPSTRPVSADVAAASAEVHERFQQGVAMLHARRFDLAVVALRRATELAPRLPAPHANLGYAYVGLQDWPAARSEFERAIDLQPRQVNAYYGLALVADAQGDRASAVGAMRTYVHLAPAGDPFVPKARAALWEWQSAPSPDDFDLPTAGGGRLRSADWRGRVAVVNVWAIWCEPCRTEMPALQSLAARLDPARFVVATIAAQSDEFGTREWLRARDVRLPTALDPNAATTRARLGIETYPATLVLDATGRVVMRLPGAQDWADPKLRARLEAIATAGASGQNPQRARLASR